MTKDERIKELEAQLEFYRSGTLPMQRRVQRLVDHLMELRDDYYLSKALGLIDEMLTAWQETGYFNYERYQEAYDHLKERVEHDRDSD